MIEEARRRAYLGAMQVVSWLPRGVLPFAAPSRPELLAPLPALTEAARAPEVSAVGASETVVPAQAEVVAVAAPPVALQRPRIEVPRPAVRAPLRQEPAPEPAVAEDAVAEPAVAAPPRFALQLLRAGRCLLLVELPTGYPFQSRDPAYLLLRDLLRAAGLPDSPQQVGDGEPIRWPLLNRGALDQGPEAARDYVQAVLQREREGAACFWLVGLPAIRFGGEREAEAYCHEFAIEEVGPAWALPGLELLMEEPQRKAELWQAMRRLMPRWADPA